MNYFIIAPLFTTIFIADTPPLVGVTTTAQTVVEKCIMDEDESAFQFGITPNSHLQYPTLDSSFRRRYDYEL